MAGFCFEVIKSIINLTPSQPPPNIERFGGGVKKNSHFRFFENGRGGDGSLVLLYAQDEFISFDRMFLNICTFNRWGIMQLRGKRL
jgi:hypothetical protein